MKDTTVGFIGGGRITRIILQGWTRAGTIPLRVVVSDPNPDLLISMKNRFPGLVTDSDNAAAAGQDLVFLAVHPPVMAEVVARIGSHLKPDAVLISLAPKFSLEKLGGWLDGFPNLVRIIPNAASVIGAGFNPLAFGERLKAEDRTRVAAILAPLGECPEVAEEKLEAYALLTAMGPTYLSFQLQALRELAADFGLNDSEATHALTRMAGGAVRTLFESGLDPDEVMDLIPVKPLASMESPILDAYRTHLPAIYQKIKP